MSRMYDLGTAGVDFCGYCKASYDEQGECSCNGYGHAKGSIGTCGYCQSDYFVAPGTDCSCDGFGGDPKNVQVTIDSLHDLTTFYANLPEGTQASGLASDLDAGNFDTATFERPDGTVVTLQYVGPVAEGYVSPFEAAR